MSAPGAFLPAYPLHAGNRIREIIVAIGLPSKHGADRRLHPVRRHGRWLAAARQFTGDDTVEQIPHMRLADRSNRHATDRWEGEALEQCALLITTLRQAGDLQV